MFHLEVCGENYHEETRVMGLFSSELKSMIEVRVILVQYQCVTDTQTDRRMDGWTNLL